MRYLYSDNHLHSNPIRGSGVESIARKLKKSNFWFVALVGLPPTSYGFSLDTQGFKKALDILVKECSILRSSGLKVKCLGGFHPAIIDKMVEKGRMSIEEAFRECESIFRLSSRYVRDGLIDGFAEIGRPHYSTNPQYIVLSEHISELYLNEAKELDVPVHLHLEDGGWITAYDISYKIKRYGLNPLKIIMHHNRPRTLKHSVDMGIMSSVPAIYGIVQSIASLNPRFFVFESDYLDDPNRPGKVIYPWEIKQNIMKLHEQDSIDEEFIYITQVENIVKIYDIEPP